MAVFGLASILTPILGKFSLWVFSGATFLFQSLFSLCLGEHSPQFCLSLRVQKLKINSTVVILPRGYNLPEMEALAFFLRELPESLEQGRIGFEVGEIDLCRNCWSPTT